MNIKARRSGFTLPEVLVTVTVVAVLAAVVVPAVTQFASKGDSPAVKQDITSLQTAVTTFITDVRKTPGSLEQLTRSITDSTGSVATDNADAGGTPYGDPDVLKWKGPYSQISLDGAGKFTSNGAGITFGPGLAADSVKWLRTPVTSPVTCGGLLDADKLIDGAVTAGTEGSTGILRFAGCVLGGTVTRASSPTSAFLRLTPVP